MSALKPENIQAYLKVLLGKPVTILGLAPLGSSSREEAIKGYGYGTPIQVEYQVGDARRRAVLETLSPGPFGHEHMADRAQALLWDHQTFNRLSRHVRSLDVGGFESSGNLISLGQVEEFFALKEYAEGQEYFRDLIRLRDHDRLTDLDPARADALCDYLVEIHRLPRNEPGLYWRRIRELIGHSECIMGLTDSYPLPLSRVSQ